jgi:hypothetical protein
MIPPPKDHSSNEFTKTTCGFLCFLSPVKKCFPIIRWLIIIVMWVYHPSIVVPGISVFLSNVSVSEGSVSVVHSRFVDFKRTQKFDGEVVEEFRLQL